MLLSCFLSCPPPLVLVLAVAEVFASWMFRSIAIVCSRRRETDAGCQNKTVHLRPPSKSCRTRGRSHVTSAPDSEASKFQHTEIPKTNLCGPDPCVYRPAHVRPCKDAGNLACDFSSLLFFLCSLFFAAATAAARAALAREQAAPARADRLPLAHGPQHH